MSRRWVSSWLMLTRLIDRARPVSGSTVTSGPVESRVAGGDVEMGRDAGQRGRQDAIVAPAEDRVVRAGHADVGLVGGAVVAGSARRR